MFFQVLKRLKHIYIYITILYYRPIVLYEIYVERNEIEFILLTTLGS